MAKTVEARTSGPVRHSRPALTPEARENQLISKSMNLAEKLIDEGTASSQIIIHYLKLGTVREQVELEKLRKENALTDAKIESLKSQKNIEDLYKNAINAMRVYNGMGSTLDDDDIDE